MATPDTYTNDGSTGYYPFPAAGHTVPPNSPILQAEGWSAWVADGRPLATPGSVTAGALRVSVLTTTLTSGANTVAHGITDPLPGTGPATVYIVPLATPSGVVFPTEIADATNIYVSTAAAQTVTLALLY